MSDNVRYPPSTTVVEYPYNQATCTRSGHEIHINDTPGSESLKVSHKIGTFVEINETGRWNQVVVGKSYTYFKDGVTETTDGNKDVKVAGNLNHNVDNSINDAVGYDRHVSTGGDMTVKTGGAKIDHTSEDSTETVDGDKTLAIQSNNYVFVSGEQVNYVGGPKKDLLSDDWQVTSQGSVEVLNTNGTFRIKTQNFIVEADSIVLKTSSGASLNLSSLIEMIVAGSINITSSANASIKAAAIHLNDS